MDEKVRKELMLPSERELEVPTTKPRKRRNPGLLAKDIAGSARHFRKSVWPVVRRVFE